MSLGFSQPQTGTENQERRLHDQIAAGVVIRDVHKAQLRAKTKTPQKGLELNVPWCQGRKPHLSVESKIPNVLHSLNQVIMIVGLMTPAQTPL